MALRYYERVTTDDGSHEMQYVGEISVEGEIIDGDEDAMELISDDMKRMQEAALENESQWEIINSLMSLHTGRNYQLIDDRPIDEYSEEGREAMKDKHAEKEIRQSLQDADTEFDTQKTDTARRLLASHDDPFPIDAVLLAAKQARSPEWVTKMKAECETSADQRRHIAQSDAIVPVLNLLLTGDDPYAGLR